MLIYTYLSDTNINSFVGIYKQFYWNLQNSFGIFFTIE